MDSFTALGFVLSLRYFYIYKTIHKYSFDHSVYCCDYSGGRLCLKELLFL